MPTQERTQRPTYLVGEAVQTNIARCLKCPEGIIKEWIYEELERQGREGTTEEYSKVVDELPDMVQQSDIKRIVARLFPVKGV
jgi:hypothetical protein